MKEAIDGTHADTKPGISQVWRTAVRVLVSLLVFQSSSCDFTSRIRDANNGLTSSQRGGHHEYTAKQLLIGKLEIAYTRPATASASHLESAGKTLPVPRGAKSRRSDTH